MRILLTGATGFVGRHVAARLAAEGHALALAVRDPARLPDAGWARAARVHRCDLHAPADVAELVAGGPPPEMVVHLAWPGVGAVNDPAHLTRTLPAELHLADRLTGWGVPRLMVAGTCLEYGLQCGPLTEEQETRPTTPYGLAKDSLRKALEMLRRDRPFGFQWLRLFYLHGEGQPARSLLPQLERAIAEGAGSFAMSRGDQLRDYLPVTGAAAHAAALVRRPEIDGVINCCSGEPVAVVDLVRAVLAARGIGMRLDRGRHPCPAHEPHAFWGVPAKLRAIGAVPAGPAGGGTGA